MKIFGLHLDRWLIPYWIGVIGLIAVFVVAIFRVLGAPLCTPNAQGVCPVDGGSVLGFTGGMLALAATLLASIGAFAIAYWWAKLNEKVEKQVDVRVNAGIQKHLEEQEKKFQDQMADMATRSDQLLIGTQKRIMERTERLEELVGINEDLLDLLFEHITEPWALEGQADILFKLGFHRTLAFQMARSYFEVLKQQLIDSDDTIDLKKQIHGIKYTNALSKTSYKQHDEIMLLWDGAKHWIRRGQKAKDPGMSILLAGIDNEMEKNLTEKLEEHIKRQKTRLNITT